MREMDILIGGFVDAHIADLDAGGSATSRNSLDVEDQKAFSWLCGTDRRRRYDTGVLARIAAFHHHEKPINIWAGVEHTPSRPSRFAGEGTDRRTAPGTIANVRRPLS